MRISDWSSVVCSSDLLIVIDIRGLALISLTENAFRWNLCPRIHRVMPNGEAPHHSQTPRPGRRLSRCRPHSPDRKSVVQGKSVSVRVAIGGRRIIIKKTSHNNKGTYSLNKYQN